MDAFLKFLPIVISVAAFVVSLWGDWIKDTFGLRGKARLTLDVDPKTAAAHYHRGWIDEATEISQTDDWAVKPIPEHAGRLKLHFFRAKISNHGQVPARNVSVWIRGFECCDPQSTERPLENVMPLRWSDFWRLITDRTKRKVSGSPVDISFALLPGDSSKYCDICFYYDRGGPPQIGGLKRGLLYFAVLNVPSSSYAIEKNGDYALHLHVAAENARPLQTTLDLTVNWNDEWNPVKMKLRGGP